MRTGRSWSSIWFSFRRSRLASRLRWSPWGPPWWPTTSGRKRSFSRRSHDTESATPLGVGKQQPTRRQVSKRQKEVRTMEKIRALIQDKKGANLVEYIIVVAVIALICIAAFRTFGTAVTAKTA